MTRSDTLPARMPPATAIPVADPVAHRRRWRILGVLALSLVIISLDNTVLNVALPSVQRGLNASAKDLQWIVDAYTLVFAGLVLLGGNLGDRYGRKRCLQIGLLILAAGSTLAVLSDTTSALIVARASMGLGGAFIMPATLSITSSVFTGAERAKAIGLWSACAGIGVALGPVAGGWLVEHYWWGSVFLINIPIVSVALIAGAVLIPGSRDPATGPPDLAGATLSTMGITALVYAIIAAPVDGWDSAPVLGSFFASVVLVAAFIAVELRSPHPMLPLWFFHNARFSAACSALALTFFALLGSMYFLTQYLQIVRGYTTLEAGLRTLPAAIGLALAAARGDALTKRYGTKRVVAVGMALTGCGLGMFTLIRPDSSYAMVLVGLAVMGLGMGATMAPATESIMGAVPGPLAGVGSAVNDSVRQLSGALGVAILGSVLTSRYSHELAPGLKSLDNISASANKVLLDSVASAHSASNSVVHPTLSALADSAFVSAMNLTALVAASAAIVGALIAAAFLPAREVAVAASPLDYVPAPPKHKGKHRAVGRHRNRTRTHATAPDFSRLAPIRGVDGFSILSMHEAMSRRP